MASLMLPYDRPTDHTRQWNDYNGRVRDWIARLLQTPGAVSFMAYRTVDGASPNTITMLDFRTLEEARTGCQLCPPEDHPSGDPLNGRWIIPECSWSNARRSRLSRSGLDGTVAPTRAWPRLASGWRGNVEMSKVSTCLWFGKDAEAAVRFYVSLVPDSCLEHIQRSPSAWPGGEGTWRMRRPCGRF